jgi:hypothetical protein
MEMVHDARLGVIFERSAVCHSFYGRDIAKPFRLSIGEPEPAQARVELT